SRSRSGSRHFHGFLHTSPRSARRTACCARRTGCCISSPSVVRHDGSGSRSRYSGAATKRHGPHGSSASHRPRSTRSSPTRAGRPVRRGHRNTDGRTPLASPRWPPEEGLGTWAWGLAASVVKLRPEPPSPELTEMALVAQPFRAAIAGALITAAVSTLGDYLWKNVLPHGLPVYWFAHAIVRFASSGLWLGLPSRRPVAGALGAIAVGCAATAGFYFLQPAMGYAAMFPLFFAMWIGLGVLTGRVL